MTSAETTLSGTDNSGASAQDSTQTYRGRFAPSPTGPLHFGSLVAALASWLDAKSRHGEWLVRIEDIDPPRVVKNSDRQILTSLEAHGLHWDGAVEYQSARLALYAEALEALVASGVTYRCSCSRTDLAEMGGIYDGRCKYSEPAASTPHAIRFAITEDIRWTDLVQGPAHFDANALNGDFVVFRRDQLYSYQLAVAVDDYDQGISQVIRGYDLFDSTARQLLILKALNKKAPHYGHFAIATDSQGTKLGKQNQAQPLIDSDAATNLIAALDFLGHPAPAELKSCKPEEILKFAQGKWRLDKVPVKQSIKVC